MGVFKKLFKKNEPLREAPAPETSAPAPDVGGAPRPAYKGSVNGQKSPKDAEGGAPRPAYKGSEPYAFVSYAHSDHEAVYAEIRRFQEAGFHIWYDEGISPGNEWTKEIAAALQGCALFIVMISPDSAARRNVQNEINFAVNRELPFLAIHLIETELPPDMELQIGTMQAILKYAMTESEYTRKYTAAFERLGLKRFAPEPPAAPEAPPEPETPPAAPAPAAPEEVYDDSPEDAKKRANGDLVRVEGFDIEHGSLRGYFGTEKDLVLPNAAVVIRSDSFTRCRLFMESVDLNRAGCILRHAFSNCPRLHTVKVPPTVTSFAPDAFYNCPNVTLYVRRSQLPEGFESRFTGRAIIYTDGEGE